MHYGLTDSTLVTAIEVAAAGVDGGNEAVMLPMSAQPSGNLQILFNDNKPLFDFSLGKQSPIAIYQDRDIMKRITQ